MKGYICPLMNTGRLCGRPVECFVGGVAICRELQMKSDQSGQVIASPVVTPKVTCPDCSRPMVLVDGELLCDPDPVRHWDHEVPGCGHSETIPIDVAAMMDPNQARMPGV